jgi:hypothetical protein
MRVASFSVLFSAVCLLTAACATPKTEPPAAPQQANAANGLICASIEVTGSRFPVKECHTESEWAAIKAHGTDSLMQDTARSMPSNGGN